MKQPRAAAPRSISYHCDKPNEIYVCTALDILLLQWRARRREDYHNLYIEISEGQLSTEIEDGKTLVIDSDGSLTLRKVNGTIHYNRKTMDQYLRTLGLC